MINKGTNRFTSTYSQYTLNSAKLPSYINLKVANRILFTGELLQLFRSNKETTKDSTRILNDHTRIDSTGANSFSRSDGRTANTELNFMNEKLDSFSKEIYEISRQEFSIINFEELINKIRNHVSEV